MKYVLTVRIAWDLINAPRFRSERLVLLTDRRARVRHRMGSSSVLKPSAIDRNCVTHFLSLGSTCWNKRHTLSSFTKDKRCCAYTFRIYFIFHPQNIYVFLMTDVSYHFEMTWFVFESIVLNTKKLKKSILIPWFQLFWLKPGCWMECRFSLINSAKVILHFVKVKGLFFSPKSTFAKPLSNVPRLVFFLDSLINFSEQINRKHNYATYANFESRKFWQTL